jgi:hypothetical protein
MPSVVQNWSPSAFGASTNTASAASPTASGDAILVMAFAFGGTPTAGVANYSVTTPGLVYHFIGTIVQSPIDVELYYAENVGSSAYAVTVTALEGQGDTYGVLFIASELTGITATPFVHFNAAGDVFETNLPSGTISTTAGNLLTGSAVDQFGDMLEGSFSAGATHPGTTSVYSPNISWSGDWSVAVGGSIEYTDQGGGGNAASFIVEWQASSVAPSPNNVAFDSMNF